MSGKSASLDIAWRETFQDYISLPRQVAMIFISKRSAGQIIRRFVKDYVIKEHGGQLDNQPRSQKMKTSLKHSTVVGLSLGTMGIEVLFPRLATKNQMEPVK